MPTHKDLDERAERTNAAAAQLIAAERLARAEKTERLRAQRLGDARVGRRGPGQSEPRAGREARDDGS